MVKAVQCCVCYAFRNPDGSWKKCPLINKAVGPGVSHTYCPPCMSAAYKQYGFKETDDSTNIRS